MRFAFLATGVDAVQRLEQNVFLFCVKAIGLEKALFVCRLHFCQLKQNKAQKGDSAGEKRRKAITKFIVCAEVIRGGSPSSCGESF